MSLLQECHQWVAFEILKKQKKNVSFTSFKLLKSICILFLFVEAEIFKNYNKERAFKKIRYISKKNFKTIYTNKQLS